MPVNWRHQKARTTLVAIILAAAAATLLSQAHKMSMYSVRVLAFWSIFVIFFAVLRLLRGSATPSWKRFLIGAFLAGVLITINEAIPNRYNSWIIVGLGISIASALIYYFARRRIALWQFVFWIALLITAYVLTIVPVSAALMLAICSIAIIAFLIIEIFGRKQHNSF